MFPLYDAEIQIHNPYNTVVSKMEPVFIESSDVIGIYSDVMRPQNSVKTDCFSAHWQDELTLNQR